MPFRNTGTFNRCGSTPLICSAHLRQLEVQPELGAAVFENGARFRQVEWLKPYEKFAEMINHHWGGIAAHYKPQNKVALGFVEGLNNNVRVIQRRAYGPREEEFLRLKIFTCIFPAL